MVKDELREMKKGREMEGTEKEMREEKWGEPKGKMEKRKSGK